MERKIGEIFECNGKKCKVVVGTDCDKCLFDPKDCDDFKSIRGECVYDSREDMTDVKFTEVTEQSGFFPSSEKSILRKAQEIIDGSRNSDYGDPVVNFNRISKMVYHITGKQVDPATCCAVLMAVKLSREAYRHKEDNLIDLCGYAEIYNRIMTSENSCE